MQGNILRKNDPEYCPVLIDKNDTQDLVKCEDAAPDAIKKCEGGIPNIRFQGFTDDWEQRKFGDMFERRMERNGGQFDNTRWISVAKMYFQEPEKVTSNNINTRTYVMRKGDIAFEGHPNAEFKYGRFVANDIGDGVISELFPIYKHIDEYDLNYWKYAIQLESVMQSRLVRCIEISYTSSNKLEEKSFLKESIYVPKLDEQHKIGDYFAELDNLITLHQRKCDETRELKKYMLQKMFPKEGEKVPEIRFQGFTGEWEQRKVGDLLIERNQQAPMSDEYPLMAFIANEGVAPKGERYDRSALVTDTVNKLYKKTEKGDFIYSSNNLETGSIGLNKYGKACISPVYSIFEPTGIADSDFLGRRLVRKDFINAMVKWRQGVIYGQWRIHESDFLRIEITVPSVEEQRKIGTYLDQLDSLITLYQRKCDKLKEIKRYMLQNMFPQKI